MIVVVGGSGLLGRQIVGTLTAQGERVRVVVRDTIRARRTLGVDVDVRGGDVRQPGQLDEVLSGVTTVVSAFHGFLGGRGNGPQEVDVAGNRHVVDAARRAGASVVLVSMIGATADSDLELARAKHAAEEHLRNSGTPWTIVRSGLFLETWLAILTQTAGRSGRPVVFGRGDRLLPFVSATDVAAVTSRAAVDATLHGQVLEVTGTPLTMCDLAQELQRSRGWQGELRHVPQPVLRALGYLARPTAPALARKARAALAMDLTQPALPGATSQLGRPPRQVRDVLRSLLAPAHDLQP